MQLHLFIIWQSLKHDESEKRGEGKHTHHTRGLFLDNWCCLFTSLVYISKYQYNWVWRLWLSQLHVWIYLVWRWQGCCWTSYNVQDSPPQQRITHLKMSVVPRLRNTAIFSSPNSQRPFSIIVLSTFSWKSLKVFLRILGWERKSFFLAQRVLCRVAPSSLCLQLVHSPLCFLCSSHMGLPSVLYVLCLTMGPYSPSVRMLSFLTTPTLTLILTEE